MWENPRRPDLWIFQKRIEIWMVMWILMFKPWPLYYVRDKYKLLKARCALRSLGPLGMTIIYWVYWLYCWKDTVQTRKSAQSNLRSKHGQWPLKFQEGCSGLVARPFLLWICHSNSTNPVSPTTNCPSDSMSTSHFLIRIWYPVCMPSGRTPGKFEGLEEQLSSSVSNYKFTNWQPGWRCDLLAGRKWAGWEYQPLGPCSFTSPYKWKILAFWSCTLVIWAQLIWAQLGDRWALELLTRVVSGLTRL